MGRLSRGRVLRKPGQPTGPTPGRLAQRPKRPDLLLHKQRCPMLPPSLVRSHQRAPSQIDFK